MHKHGKQVPVDRCRKVPVNRCHKVPVKVPIEIKRRECPETRNQKDRPKRHHRAGKKCKVVSRQEPRLQCSRVR